MNLTTIAYYKIKTKKKKNCNFENILSKCLSLTSDTNQQPKS